jgi:hypothetical protein
MKKALQIIFIFFVLFSFSQNTDITSKTWYAYQISRAGNLTNITTDFLNFPFAKLNLSITGQLSISNEILKSDCNKGFTSLYTLSTNGSDDFIGLTDFARYSTVSNCDSSDNQMLNFMEEFTLFFEDNLTQNLIYFIQDIYGFQHLKIWTANGDFIWLKEFPTYGFAPNEISQTPWYLSKMIVDNQIYPMIDFSAYGFTDIVLNFKNYLNEISVNGGVYSEQTFQTQACNYNTALALFNETDLNDFYIYFSGGTLDDCGDTATISYGNMYNSFYFDNDPGVFSYEIVVDNGVESLVITNNQNDQAIYLRYTLPVNESVLDQVNIYPNPVTSILKIDMESKNVKYIKLTDVLGKNILKTKSTSINVQNLTKGVYLLQIVTLDGNIFFHKIIKK